MMDGIQYSTATIAFQRPELMRELLLGFSTNEKPKEEGIIDNSSFFD